VTFRHCGRPLLPVSCRRPGNLQLPVSRCRPGWLQLPVSRCRPVRLQLPVSRRFWLSAPLSGARSVSARSVVLWSTPWTASAMHLAPLHPPYTVLCWVVWSFCVLCPVLFWSPRLSYPLFPCSSCPCDCLPCPWLFPPVSNHLHLPCVVTPQCCFLLFRTLVSSTSSNIMQQLYLKITAWKKLCRYNDF